MPHTRILTKPKIFGKKDEKPQKDVQDQCEQKTPPIRPPDVPENILVFRTITALLQKIQQEQPFQVIPPEGVPNDLQRLELKLANAFSTVAVIEHEIVAIVSKLSGDALEITACTGVSEDDKATSSSPSHASSPWRLVATKNFRWSERPETKILSAKGPIIDDPQTLPGLIDHTDLSIQKFVEEYWSHRTLAQHLLVLSKLLTMKDPATGQRNGPTISTFLLKYVVSTCYPKMNHRLNGLGLSARYIRALKKISAIPFNESFFAEDEHLSPDEKLNDFLFLTKFVEPGGMKLHKSYPNITKQAKLAKAKQDYQLYSKETCKEFHSLFVELLQCFGYYLKILQGTTDRGEDSVPSKGSEEFKSNVECVLLFGYALQRLAKGRALRLHMKNIEPLLRGLLEEQNVSASTEPPRSDGNQDEIDDEIKEVQPFLMVQGKEKPLWSTFIDWVRLMLAHFDAVDILVGFVTGPTFTHDTISIQILSPPDVDRYLLPWQKLFDDSSIFPRSDPINMEIYKYIQNGLKDYDKAAKVKESWKSDSIAKTIKPDNFAKTIKYTQDLGTSNLPGWKQCSEELIAKLQDSPHSLRYEISQDIERLCESVTFFDYLKTNTIFSGTLHCEVCIASLLNEKAPVNKHILALLKGFGHVIGVSKHCCPVCTHLLHLLEKEAGNSAKFIVRGSHNNVSACTLPPWLPAHIVTSMNQFFGAKLKEELEKLMKRPTLLRKRAVSTGSHRLSSESNREVGDNGAQIDGSLIEKYY